MSEFQTTDFLMFDDGGLYRIIDIEPEHVVLREIHDTRNEYRLPIEFVRTFTKNGALHLRRTDAGLRLVNEAPIHRVARELGWDSQVASDSPLQWFEKTIDRLRQMLSSL